jgi:flagellar hook-basal body complex protein FliE
VIPANGTRLVHRGTKKVLKVETNGLLQLRSAILSQNTALNRAAGRDGLTPASPNADVSKAGFSETFSNAIQAVNTQQAKSSAISESYERGETTDIVQVMVERQKASLGFEATLQVRNKLLSAYRDIMNMPV